MKGELSKSFSERKTVYMSDHYCIFSVTALRRSDGTQKMTRRLRFYMLLQIEIRHINWRVYCGLAPHFLFWSAGVLLLLALSGQSVSLDDQPIKMVFPVGFEPTFPHSKGGVP